MSTRARFLGKHFATRLGNVPLPVNGRAEAAYPLAFARRSDSGLRNEASHFSSPYPRQPTRGAKLVLTTP